MRSGASYVLWVSLAMWMTASCTPGSVTSWPADRNSNTIVILSGTDTSVAGGKTGIFQQLADWWNRYMLPQEGFTIRFDVLPGGATAEHSQMLAAAQTGDPTTYDIYNLDNEWISEFAAGGYIRSLQGHLSTDGFLPGPLRSGQDPSGQLYAAPFTTDVGLLYYRTDLVTAAQVKRLRSYREMLGLARQAAARDGQKITSYVGQFAQYEGLTVNSLEAIWGHDPNAFALDGSIADRAAVAKGLADQASAFAPVGPYPAAASTPELSYEESQALGEFAGGRAVFMRNWPIDYSQLLTPKISVSRHFAVNPLPFPSVLGGQDLAIAWNSANPNNALKVVQWLTSLPVERCLFAVGGFPATRGRAYDTRIWPHSSLPPNNLCGSKAGSSVDIGPVILTALRTAIPRPITPYYTEISDLLQIEVSKFLRAKVSSTDAGPAPDPGDVTGILVRALGAAATGRAPPP